MAWRISFQEPGLPVSILSHATLFVAGLLSFGQPKSFEDAVETVAVEVVSASEFTQMTRGEKTAPQVVPNAQPRVDRVAEVKQEAAPGEAPKQVDAPPPPPQKAQEAADRQERTATLPPLPPLRPIQPPKPAEQPKPQPAQAPPKANEREDEEAEEALRQRQAKQKAEEQRRLDEQRKAEEAKKLAEQKAADERKKLEDAKKREEAAKLAAERKKREEERKAAEAQSKATMDAVRQRLALNREAPANAGNTGAAVNRQSTLGTATGSAQRLSLSDRDALLGLIGDQIRRCWSLPPVGKPNTLPRVEVNLNPDGSLAARPRLINSSAEPTFRPVAESGMRAINACAPFSIPARFAPMFDSWRQIVVQLNPDDL